MRKWRLGRELRYAALLAVLVASSGTATSFAVTSTSTNYQVTETEFGGGSSSQSCSGQYCARASIGDIAGGSSKSSGSGPSAAFGSLTDGEPLLEVIVNPGESNLGTLETNKTASKTTSIQIRNYLSDGYTLQITGTPPKYGNYTLKTPASPTAAVPGTEQFGINLAANTTPNVGASPMQVPSDQTSFGIVTDLYKTPNLFKYTSGDVVARSNSQSGQTNYTISMIVNIANSTPAGHYSGDFSAVVIPVY